MLTVCNFSKLLLLHWKMHSSHKMLLNGKSTEVLSNSLEYGKFRLISVVTWAGQHHPHSGLRDCRMEAVLSLLLPSIELCFITDGAEQREWFPEAELEGGKRQWKLSLRLEVGWYWFVQVLQSSQHPGCQRCAASIQGLIVFFFQSRKNTAEK